MTTIYKRREGGSSLGSFSDGVESVIFHIDLVIIIAGGLRTHSQWPTGDVCFFFLSRILFVNPFTIQTARVIIAYNLMPEKEEVCSHCSLHEIECDTIYKKRGII